MNRKKLFEHVYPISMDMGMKFKDFKRVLERNDFSDLDEKNRRLKNMPLFGEDSLLTALNIDGEDQATVEELSSALPTFKIFFSPEEQNRSKAISLLKAQVEAVKKLATNFQSALATGITGKETGEEYISTIPGIEDVIQEDNLTKSFINKVIRTFTGTIAGTTEPSGIDDFVSTESGKKLVSLLRGLKIDTPLTKLIDSIFDPVLERIQGQNLKVVLDSLDQVDEDDMPEITARNMETGDVVDYLSGKTDMSEIEMAGSMDPYVRLGLFYQLCLLQQPEFISKVTSDVKGTKLSYPDFMSEGKPFEQSMRTLFGRGADLSALEPYMEPLNRLSLSMIDSVWNGQQSDRVKATLFVPAMQVFYVSIINFALAGALYSFLTKKSTIVMQAKSAEEAERVKRSEAQTSIKTPQMMESSERGKKIAELFRNPDLRSMLSDNTLYLPGKSGYDPAKIKALKELVYYMFGGKNSGIDSVKNWDVTKNPIDGNYDQFFSNIIKDIQTKHGVQPLRNGIGDGKIGPITKEFFQKAIPLAISALV